MCRIGYIQRIMSEDDKALFIIQKKKETAYKSCNKEFLEL
jgi:hypothetical protein